MFSLFNPPFTSDRNKIVLPLFDYLDQQTKHEVKKVVQHYRENVIPVKGDHRLVKLLNELKSYMSLSPETLVSVMRANSNRLCGAYNFVSPTINGKINNQGDMYNRNNPELFIYVEYPFDVKKCMDHYKELKPVRVISHDFSDFGYGLANGQYLSAESGLSIFTIDLALLALQYQQWYHKERYVKERDYHHPTTVFISRYILTGLLSTHMDNVLFNRFMNRLTNKQNAPTKASYPFMLVNYGDRYDNQFDLLIEQFKTRSTEWSQRLNTLPSLEYGHYFRSISFPDAAPTRQIRWAMVLSKLKVIEFLLLTDQFAQNESISLNDRESIARELRILLNDRSFELTVPSNTLLRIHRVFDIVNKQQPR